MGVLTVRDFHRYEMESSIWDLYKEVTGIRPRHMDFKSMSFEELEKEYSYLLDQMKRQEEHWIEESEIDWEQEFYGPKVDPEAPEPIDYVACHYQDGWL
jgi:hypothetical protein